MRERERERGREIGVRHQREENFRHLESKHRGGAAKLSAQVIIRQGN